MSDTTDFSKLELVLDLLGFYFKLNSEEPDLYMLMFFGDKEIPLGSDTGLLFFDNPNLASTVFDTTLASKRQFELPLEDDFVLYDFVQMLHLIENENEDNDAMTLDCINLMTDFQEWLSLPLLPPEKKILYSFADHLTFNREFKSFLDESEISRGEAKEAIQWLMKQIFPRCMVLTSDGKIPLEEWMRREQVTLY
ncbi:MAG: hypothetical protein GY765_33485 [bacterium]|nr:hypothetical protein [bacterium]